MTVASDIRPYLGAAWSAFELNLGVARVNVEIAQVLYIRSDPIDGAWVTCMAEAVLEGETFHGFATGRDVTDDLRARAIAEAVERAIWASGVGNPALPASLTSSHVRSSAPGIRLGDPAGGVHLVPDTLTRSTVDVPGQLTAEPSTSGSAVHRTPELAILAGAAEVVERIACIGGFHGRDLGAPLALSPTFSDISDTKTYAWHDPASGLVAVAVSGETTMPRLAMAASLIRIQTTADDALVHCLSEIVQSRAWIRRRAGRLGKPRTAGEIVDPATRGEYWCSCTYDLVEELIGELNDASVGTPPRLPDTSDLYLVSAAEIGCREGPPMWYARMAAPEFPYAVHSASSEMRLFSAQQSGRSYLPHPYI